MRFGEDALRILRALRFAAVYGFAVEETTAAAAHALRHTLENVAAERIRVELAKLLCGRACGGILRAYRDIVAQVLPEVAAMFDFDQRNPHHCYDVWEHAVRATEAVPPTEVLRLTMLLHDAGKPAAFTLDEAGVGHAYGHGEKSRALAEEAMARLKADRATAERVALLVGCHDMPLSQEPRLLKRRLNRLGEEALRQLIEVQRADSLAKGTCDAAAVEAWAAGLRDALDALMAQAPCFTLRDLAVDGRDMMALGLRGKAVGTCLNALLDGVLDERLPNNRDALMAEARRITGG